MHETFRALLDNLEPRFDTLMAMPPHKTADLPRSIHKRGVYLFSERDRPLYVGRSNGLRRRLLNHSRERSLAPLFVERKSE